MKELLIFTLGYGFGYLPGFWHGQRKARRAEAVRLRVLQSVIGLHSRPSPSRSGGSKGESA